ncbi:LytR/AlgR family response regulator transcription factor [Noviherbaspirillum pedocola]|uniref:Response regulator transcription factor n=1 Tax=Noviherbaspirillum pedocola TaxID=2801341 RepID=A0A934SWN3_9BURK|nr:LytTR family DNA-binding domain-containing protein [Noviherbaspirillum pedocola]MBK4733208.1 response regulator transcription factor [Noviherbaspirillum pedocola]
MNTFRALIAEDEPVLAAMLAAALQRVWPELQIVATASNGVAAVDDALALRPDVLFLDIRMPGKTGLEAAQELAEEWPDGVAFPLLVFVTAYDEYAIAAFEQAAVDYVQKPVSEARLVKTVTRLRERLEKPRGGELDAVLTQLRALAAPAAGNAPAERLTMIRAAVGNTVRLIPVDEVLYFEATDKYVNVVTAEGEALIRTPLKDLLPGLDAQRFWQIHRGTVVNITQVTTALRDEAGKLRLALKGRRETLPVSRVYAHLFRQM